MALQKKPTSLPPEVLAAAKERSAQARKKIEQVGRSNLHTPEERADGAPFYFVLRNFIRQLKAAREAARMTLEDVSARTGMAVESLSRLETGANTNPTWKTLGSYAAAIGVAPVLSVEAPQGKGGDTEVKPHGKATCQYRGYARHTEPASDNKSSNATMGMSAAMIPA
jgi:transcriptional regulator with XRE-family HTH domain